MGVMGAGARQSGDGGDARGLQPAAGSGAAGSHDRCTASIAVHCPNSLNLSVAPLTRSQVVAMDDPVSVGDGNDGLRLGSKHANTRHRPHVVPKVGADTPARATGGSCCLHSGTIARRPYFGVFHVWWQ